MGISSKHGKCETCGETLQLCNGHFGVIKLVLPAFHIGYFRLTMAILQNICKVLLIFLLRSSNGLTTIRIVQESYFRRMNAGNSFGLYVAPISTMCSAQPSVKRSMTSVERRKHATHAEPLMARFGRVALIH